MCSLVDDSINKQTAEEKRLKFDLKYKMSNIYDKGPQLVITKTLVAKPSVVSWKKTNIVIDESNKMSAKISAQIVYPTLSPTQCFQIQFRKLKS